MAAVRKRDTYILTLFRDPQGEAEPRGHIRHVLSGEESTFASMEEMVRLLREFAEKWGKREESAGEEDLHV